MFGTRLGGPRGIGGPCAIISAGDDTCSTFPLHSPRSPRVVSKCSTDLEVKHQRAVCKPYMSVPIKGEVSKYQDSYNFYVSQLRITIEHCFGVLVYMWGYSENPCKYP